MRKRPRYFYTIEDDIRRFGLGAALLAGFVLLYTMGSLVGFIQP